MQNITLDEQSLLKKDATVLMPGFALHTDPSIWGPDVDTFRHKRFLQTDKKERPNPVAFRAFGGGTFLCPGRHFATTEIIALVVMFIIRYDMRPLNNGPWIAPTTKKTNIALVITEPDYDFEVEVMPRAGFEDGWWEFRLKGSISSFGIVAEDQ